MSSCIDLTQTRVLTLQISLSNTFKSQISSQNTITHALLCPGVSVCKLLASENIVSEVDGPDCPLFLSCDMLVAVNPWEVKELSTRVVVVGRSR